jgi:hypothetical protein
MYCIYDANKMTLKFYFFKQQPPVGEGLLIIKASQPHSVRHTTLGRTRINEYYWADKDELKQFTNFTHNDSHLKILNVLKFCVFTEQCTNI